MPRAIKQDLVLVQKHASVIKLDALFPQQVQLFLYIRPRRRLQLLGRGHTGRLGTPALGGFPRDARTAGGAAKGRPLDDLAVVAVDVAGGGNAAVAGDARGKDVVAEGVADGARRGAQGAGHAPVRGDAAGGDLLQQVEDALLKGREEGGLGRGEGGGGGEDGGGGCDAVRVGGRVHGDAGGHDEGGR